MPEVKYDGETQSDDAQQSHNAPELNHGVIRAEEAMRAERDLRFKQKIGEFGEAGLVAFADESLKDFRVRPVAHIKNGAGEQGSYRSGKADRERRGAGSKRA
jgi:hypothetical protein